MLAVIFWLPPTALYIGRTWLLRARFGEFYRICVEGVAFIQGLGRDRHSGVDFGELVCFWNVHVPFASGFPGIVLRF